jgi:hypothetical protein
MYPSTHIREEKNKKEKKRIKKKEEKKRIPLTHNNSPIKLYYYYIYGVSAGKRDQIDFFKKKKFLSKIDVNLVI